MSAQITPDGIYTSRELARTLFRKSVKWFYTYRNHAGRDEGFPPPVSRNGHPRWSGRAILAWMERGGRDRVLSLLPDDPAANIVDIREKLRLRSRAMAAAHSRRLSP